MSAAWSLASLASLASSASLPAFAADGADTTASPPAAGDAVAAAEPAWPVEFPGQCTESDPNFDLEILYYEGKYKQGLAEVEKRLAQPSPTSDLYWMKTRFMYEIGEALDENDTSIDRMAWYQTMVDTVDAGLAQFPGDLHLKFARGVAMGRLGTTRGVLSSLFMAKDIERDWLDVAEQHTWDYSSLGGSELLPCDAYHALGIYYRLVPDYWIVQMIAGTRGDLDKSLAWHQKAVACKPREIQNYKELGATQLCIGEKRKDPAMTQAGIASLNKARSLHPNNERARIDIRHSAAMIADPSLGCGYSRDGQEDLDEKKLEKQ